MADDITILHLSDLQFGRNHRYPKGRDSYQTLFAKLSEDLDLLAEKHGLRPDTVIVTGDVAERSLEGEYRIAADFLEKLSAKLELARERFVVIPGNHDINRDLCQGAGLMAKGSGRPFEEPYFEKFANYQRFFNSFFSGIDVFDEEHLFQLRHFEAQQVLVAGFNSCIQETEKKHHGWIGLDQVHQATLLCDERDPEGRCLRIAALHHNFSRKSDHDNENLRDADHIRPSLEKGRFYLLLHGHRHIADPGQIKSPGSKAPITILSTGSAGLDAKALPDRPNQYQVIKIECGNDVTLYMRQYSAQTFGLAGKGKWVADSSIKEGGVVPLQLGLHRATKPARRAAKPSLKEARRRFLKYVAEQHRYLPLRGFGRELRVPLELESLYVSLRAAAAHLPERQSEAENSRPGAEQDLEIASLLRLCRRNRYPGLVILGDPGSGKTTLLQFLALQMALGQPAAQTGMPSDTVPLLLPLRRVEDFRQSLAAALHSFYTSPNLKLPVGFFERTLESGRCLVLLDGLDEVASTDKRRQAGEWIEDERVAHPGNLIAVTSRFAGYKGESRLPGHFLEVQVRDFSPEDVRRFVRNWYRQVETRQRSDTPQWREEARKLSDDLLGHLERAGKVQELARNPLMLHIICLVHRTRGTMPQRRSELYEECIQVLLQKWDEAKGIEVYLTAAEARQVLRPLALWLHSKEGRTSAGVEEVKDVLRPHLQRVKREIRQAEEQLDRILTSVRDRSGLFVGFDVERYGFHHLSFQEFLAAEEVVKQGQHSRLVDEFGSDWWREPTLLALGLDDPRFQKAFFAALLRSERFPGHLEQALTCVREALAPEVAPFREALLDRQLAHQARYQCVLLLRELGGPQALEALQVAAKDADRKVASAARQALVQLGAVEEAESIASSAASGESRINPVDGSELIRIPAGKFIMGGSQDGPGYPPHEEHLEEYFIARHPVTNAQYRRFVEATGHREPSLWDEKRLNQPNQPVVGVSWNDALAYCRWAGLRLHSEEQWEKAARGTDGRRWPWGNDSPTEKHCNFDSKVGAPTEVGSYPDGASPYGCHDMAGNVWEWCSTKWREYYSQEADDSLEGGNVRVVRGGSFYKGAECVRCASRLRFVPHYINRDTGFRCAQ